MSERHQLDQSVAWEAETLRFTAFPPPSVSFEIRPLWEQLVGHAPEEITEKPQLGFRQETGPLGDQHLFIVQQLSRVDIIFGVHPSRSASVPEMQLISTGSYDRASSEHTPVVRRWLATAPTLGRLAYGPVLIHRVNGKEEGYRVLQRLLPRLPIDPVNSQDLFWQINRPRASAVIPELRLNKLTRWTVIRGRRLEVVQGVGQVELVQTPLDELSAVRLETDLFTDPARPLPSEEVMNLFDELQSLAHEIMEHGDVP